MRGAGRLLVTRVRWYHEAMDLFSEPNPVSQSLFDELFELFVETSDMDRTESREDLYRQLEEMEAKIRLMEDYVTSKDYILKRKFEEL